MLNIFGIVGGHGAVATLRFQELLLKAYLADGAYHDEDFPRTIVTNLPANVISSKGIIETRDALQELLTDTAPVLNKATHVMVLCNTFHIEQDFMEQVFEGKLLSLPEMTRNEIRKQEVKKILVLGTLPTLANKLYEDETYEVIEIPVLNLIEAGMKGHTQHEMLNWVADKVHSHKADGIVLGCTDLSVFAPHLRTLTDVTVIDSLEVAVDTLIDLERTK